MSTAARPGASQELTAAYVREIFNRIFELAKTVSRRVSALQDDLPPAQANYLIVGAASGDLRNPLPPLGRRLE